MSFTLPTHVLAVDIVVLDKYKNVLLITRKDNGKTALPGGLVEENELIKEAALRELEEEVNISEQELLSIVPFGYYDELNRDVRQRVISLAFAAYVEDIFKLNCKAGDDAKSILAAHISSIPELAFDHNKIVGEAIAYTNLNKFWE